MWPFKKKQVAPVPNSWWDDLPVPNKEFMVLVQRVQRLEMAALRAAGWSAGSDGTYYCEKADGVPYADAIVAALTVGGKD